MSDIAPWRRNLLRLAYLLIAGGLSIVIWPDLLAFGQGASQQRTVVLAMLGSLSLLSLIGLIHPMKMLPVLFWEIGWKALWLAFIALPAWQGGRMDADQQTLVFDCLAIIVVFPLIPWDHVWRTYLAAPAEAWRRRPTA